MARVFIDSAMSIDGFWADRDGRSVFPLDDLYSSGILETLVDRTGAVVMSRRSFEMADDPDWFAGNYELQVPIHVITDHPPAKHPREDCGVTFSFHDTFADALAGARNTAGGRDVAIIGERSAVEAAIAADAVDEIYLRIVPTICGDGEPLMRDLAGVRRAFDVSDVRATEHAVHIRFVRNRDAENDRLHRR
jgi:dihydrofolate reductase